MKDNKVVLPMIILLLIIFLPLTIFVSFKKISAKPGDENPNHLPKLNNTLYFYDNNSLLGTYSCQNSECDISRFSVDDKDNIYYEGTGQEIKTFNNNSLVFITDGDETFLYSLTSKMKLLTVKLLKNYGAKINGDYIIVQNNENLYGLFDLNKGNFKISPKYEYMAYVGKNMVDNVINDDKLIVKENNMYFIIDNEENILSEKSALPIYDYNDKIIILKNEDKFNVLNYEGIVLLNDINILSITLKKGYVIFKTSGNSIYVYNEDLSNVEHAFVPVTSDDNYSYEVNDSTIIIKNNDEIVNSINMA